MRSFFTSLAVLPVLACAGSTSRFGGDATKQASDSAASTAPETMVGETVEAETSAQDAAPESDQSTPTADVIFAAPAAAITGATEVCYRIDVEAAGSLVWQEPETCIAADQALSINGQCDPDASDNRATFFVTHVHRAPGIELSGWADPCADGCRIAFDCSSAPATTVALDLAIAHDIATGFFDNGVVFDGIECSAKLDSCYTGGTHIELLFGDSGEREWTVVLATACAFPEGSEQALYAADIVVTCGQDKVVLPVDASGASPLTTPFGSLHYGFYSGTENGQLYANVAIDLEDLPAGCTVAALTLAAPSTRLVDGELSGNGLVYPVMVVDDMPLPKSCFNHVLSATEADGLGLRYSATSDVQGDFERPLAACNSFDGDDWTTCAP